MAKQPEKTAETQRRLRAPITTVILIACIFSLAFLYVSGIPLYISVTLALLALVVTGVIISNTNGLPGSYGLYMLGGRRGIGTVEWLSKRNKKAWRFFTEWGIVMGFGILAYFILRRRISMKMMAFGIASLILMMVTVLPNLFLSIQFIKIPGVNSLAYASVPFQGISLSYSPILYIISIAAGSLGFMLSLIIGAAAQILAGVGMALYGIAIGHPNTSQLSQQIPGLVPVIPGITIPLFAGILSLALLLVVHEFSHGVMARMAKVKIKQIGLILFGIIPIGAFVEPDEKAVAKLKPDTQTEIFIAGISANFLFSFIFFMLTAFMAVFVMPAFFRQGIVVSSLLPGYPAYNVIAPGSIILSWNGHQVSNITSLTAATAKDGPYSNISVMTNKGSNFFHTNATGRIGVELSQASIPRSTGLQNGFVNFLYAFVVLSFALNFLAATINLLPVPAFDGWRIYKNKFSKKVLIVFAVLIVASLLVLALPWIWA